MNRQDNHKQYGECQEQQEKNQRKEAKQMNNENTFDEVCEDCDNGTDMPCVSCQYDEIKKAYGINK